MFSKRYGQQQGQPQSALPKRSNRVFILQYSPQRSKSKKQNKAQQITKKSQTPFKATIQNNLNNLNEISPVPSTNTNHRSNIDRLVNLISRSRSQQRTESESGCQKLVKVLQKIIKAKNELGFFMQKLKKYTMLCSSTNYQLFIQSKHTAFPTKEVQKKGYEKIEKQLLQNINQISHNQDYSHSQPSFHFNDNRDQNNPRISPKMNQKVEKYEDITFKKMDIVSPAKINQSILQQQQSPYKGEKYFRTISKEYIPTSQTLRSQQDLNVHFMDNTSKASKILLNLKKKQKLVLNLSQSPITSKMKKGAQMEFLHLCHHKMDTIDIQSNDNIAENYNQQINIIQQLKNKTNSTLSIFPKNGSRTKLDFALPTQMTSQKTIQMKQQNKIQITFQAKNIESNKQTPSKLKKKNEVLNAKQIADRMLFGQQRKIQAPSRPQTRLNTQNPPARKRISSLPKITFTYSSRDKDERILHTSPSIKKIASPVFQKQSVVINNMKQSGNGLMRVLSNNQIRGNKQDLQSTFGSTQNARNMLINQRPEVIARSPKIRQNINQPFMNPPKQIPSKKVASNEYYNYTPMSSQRIGAPLTAKDLFNRERIISQQHYGDDIQYVGIQDEPRCCLIRKETRSKSLNQQLLNGFPQRTVF